MAANYLTNKTGGGKQALAATSAGHSYYYAVNPERRTHIQVDKASQDIDVFVTRGLIDATTVIASQPYVQVNSSTTDYLNGGDFGLTGVHIQTGAITSAAVSFIVMQTGK